MAAGSEREALLLAADQLSIELGYAGDEPIPDSRSRLRVPQVMIGILGPEDERLVSRMREALAKIAAAVGGGDSENAVGATLDAIEMVVRGELIAGKDDGLTDLLPGFVFLVALSVAEHEEALELSRRASALVEEALG